MGHVSIAAGVLGGLIAIVAAYYAYRASTTEARPVWEDDPSLRPTNFEMHNFGWVNALGAAQFWSGYYSKRAALWGLLAAVLGLISAITAWAN